MHARSKLEIVAATDSVYAALVDDKLAVKLGHDNWSPSGDGWKVSVSGDQWVRVDAGVRVSEGEEKEEEDRKQHVVRSGRALVR